jgi:uncharacterized membrane-anchored protein
VQLRSRRYKPFFYWTVILSTSTAGTTMSDFVKRDASTKYLANGATSLGWGPQGLGLGYPTGAAVLIADQNSAFPSRTGVLLVLVVLMKVPAVPNVPLFWIAFVLTRPLGATAGDLLTKPVAKGGLDLGTAGSPAVLLTVLIGLKGYAHLQERRCRAAPRLRRNP